MIIELLLIRKGRMLHINNVLEGTKGYLSGPIENDLTNFNWRIKPLKVLREEFKIDMFDPRADPKQQWLPLLKEARNQKDYNKIAQIAKDFVRKDLAMVDRSDFLIAYLPYQVLTTGTCHEIINSNNSKKPTLLVSNSNDIACIPIWYFGFIPIDCMFANWEDLYEYLRDVNNGKHRTNNRWNFIYEKSMIES